MGSFTKLNYHIVFGTRYRKPRIQETFQEALYEYIGGVIRNRKGSLIAIGGIADHVHILARVPPHMALSDVVRDVKSNSSSWIDREHNSRTGFEWQKGFGAFTVSYSMCDTVIRYIENQPEHHRRKTFAEEYALILKRHDIEFDPQYLFEGEYSG